MAGLKCKRSRAIAGVIRRATSAQRSERPQSAEHFLRDARSALRTTWYRPAGIKVHIVIKLFVALTALLTTIVALLKVVLNR